VRNFKALSLSLDRRTQAIRGAQIGRPPRGWARSIREAIGMTKGQLGVRIQLSISTIDKLERSEERGAITLASLDRLAAGLDCELVYALVPTRGRTIDEMVRERAVGMVKSTGSLGAALVTILCNAGRRRLWR